MADQILADQLTGKWGNTTSDSSATQVDQSRERRETQGTATNITQQYNLLTGYHAGTNRAAFLVLPRPHTLQATDYRTFVRGLRMIEGVQEFLLIVSRPTALPGICIETSLETGHFPEDVALSPPPPPAPSTKTFSWPIGAYAPGGNVSAQKSNTTDGGYPQPANQTYTLPPPWIVDTTRGALPGTPGVSYDIVKIDGTRWEEFQQAVNSSDVSITTPADDTVTVNLVVNSSGAPSETAAQAEFVFTIYATQAPADIEPIVVSPFLVTSRELCVCLNSCPRDGCVMIAPSRQVPYYQTPGLNERSLTNANQPAAAVGTSGQKSVLTSMSLAVNPPAAVATPAVAPQTSGATAAIQPDKHGPSSRSSIVYETKLKLPRGLLKSDQLQKSRTPVARELMHQIQNHMLASWRLPQRRAHGAVGFLDSDYVCERLTSHLPQAHLSRQIGDVNGLPQGVIKALGAKMTVADVLKLDLYRLRTHAQVELKDAISIRRKLLGFVQESTNRKK